MQFWRLQDEGKICYNKLSSEQRGLPQVVYPILCFCYNLIVNLFGPLAQLVEQTPLKRKVVSSSLTWPISFSKNKDGWRNW